MPEEPPTTWELMRAVNALRESVDKLAAGMVTQATLTLYQQAQDARDNRQDARIKELETERDAQRKARAQQWFAIALAVVGGAVTVIATLVLRGVGVS